LIVETQAVLDWLDKKKIYYLVDEAILLPNRSIALLIVEKQEALVSIWGEKLESEGWDVIDLLITDIQSRLDEVMNKAIKGEGDAE